jgi:hypothetical protein
MRLRVSTVTLATSFAIAVLASSTPARADITLYDNDGWSIYTRGLIATHYQLAIGDGDPTSMHGKVVGGQILEGAAKDPKDDSLLLSRVRSGFIGTQLGFGVRRMISDRVNVDSLIAINLADISSNRQQEGNKSVDVREAWATVNTPAGAFRLGRMFNIFGSASAPIVLLSYRYAVGNPCFVNQPTIACGSVGAGPIFANFDAQLRYESPRLAGIQAQVAIQDPNITPAIGMTPYPRTDAEVNFDRLFGSSVRFRAWVEGTHQLWLFRQDNMSKLRTMRVWGILGAALLDAGPVSIGGGARTGTGIGTRIVAEVGETSYPLSHDATKTLRDGYGFFGNAALRLGTFTVSGGGGVAYIKPTALDAPEDVFDPVTMTYGAESTDHSILKSSTEGHLVLTKQIDTLVIAVEAMSWWNEWHYGEKAQILYTGAGVNYFW